jgi:lipopolysaccharide biosynthesis glycosyltransferase
MNIQSQKSIDIVLACDDNYAELVAIFIESFYRTNTSFRFAKFHLLTNNINKETIDLIKRQIRQGEGTISTYDISNIKDLLGIQVSNTIAISSYARLFLSDLLPNDIEKVLYIDCDIVANGDLADLWDVELHSNLIAGVLDTLYSDNSKTAVGMRSDSGYVNAGLLLINLKAWREEDIKQEFLDVLKKYNGDVFHHDQGIINAVCENRKIIVHPRFNATTTYFTHRYAYIRSLNKPFYSKEEYESAIKTPVLIHFTEGFYGRPWIKNCKHPFAKYFLELRKITAWKDTPLRPDKRSLPLKVISWTFLNTPIWCYNTLQKIISVLKF